MIEKGGFGPIGYKKDEKGNDVPSYGNAEAQKECFNKARQNYANGQVIGADPVIEPLTEDELRETGGFSDIAPSEPDCD